MDARAAKALESMASGYGQEIPMRGADGVIRWVSEKVDIAPTGSGQWDRCGVVFEITERKTQEARLLESEARFRPIWEQSLDAMRLTDANGVIIAVNAVFCHLVGLSGEEIVGKPMSYPVIHQRDPMGPYRERLKKGEPEIFERTIGSRDGRKVDLEVSISYFEGRAGDKLGLSIFRDMSPRYNMERSLRESEQRFRLVWEHSLDAMRLTDGEGTVLAVNLACESLAGVAAEEIVNRPFWKIYDPLITEEMANGYRRRVENSEFGERMRSYGRLHDGRRVHLEVSFTSVSGASQQIYLTVLRNVTKQRIQLDQRTKLERKMLEAQRLESLGVLAGRLLESFGLSFLLAREGGEGVALYQRNLHEIDLVILDMTMPVMSGADAFREIRRLREDARVLLISGYSEAEANERFAGKGISGFLQKPFKREQLEEALRRLLPPSKADE